MKTSTRAFALLSIVAVFAFPLVSCATPTAASTGDPAVATASAATPLDEMRALLEKARTFMDEYKLTEAIKAYVAVLAIAKEQPSTQAEELAAKARAELTSIGTTLTIEPSPDWVDAKGNQITGSTRDIGKPSSLQPGVYLYQNMGYSKSPLPDAPIFFEFAKNSGALNVVVATDQYGKASSVISRIDSADKEVVIRAYPVFTVRGFRYAFQSVLREFTYLPPSNSVLVAALQTSEFGSSVSAETIDPVAGGLKSIGYDAIPYNAALDPALFLRAFGGDPAALRELGGERNPSYFAFVFVEVYSIKQQVYEGKAYNLFYGYARVTLRIQRSDGSVVFAKTVEVDKVSGGTAKEAAEKAYQQARKTVEALLAAVLPEIKAAFSK